MVDGDGYVLIGVARCDTETGDVEGFLVDEELNFIKDSFGVTRLHGYHVTPPIKFAPEGQRTFKVKAASGSIVHVYLGCLQQDVRRDWQGRLKDFLRLS